MVELDNIESIAWKIISERHEGKSNAIKQQELLCEIQFYDHFHAPETLRTLRGIMRELKTKRPILESLKDKPGYHKPANWDEIHACLGRRKYTLIRQYNLNKKMLAVCREWIPRDDGEQLKLFNYEDLETEVKTIRGGS